MLCLAASRICPELMRCDGRNVFPWLELGPERRKGDDVPVAGRGAVGSVTSHSGESGSWEPAPERAPLPRGRGMLAGSDPDDAAAAAGGSSPFG